MVFIPQKTANRPMPQSMNTQMPPEMQQLMQQQLMQQQMMQQQQAPAGIQPKYLGGFKPQVDPAQQQAQTQAAQTGLTPGHYGMERPPNPGYGQMGKYNTLAFDMAQNHMQPYMLQRGSNPFLYGGMPWRSPVQDLPPQAHAQKLQMLQNLFGSSMWR